MQGKKVQAALEFLISYGWAIIVVLIIIGILAHLDVLSPDMFLPQKCILPSGIACLDYRVESSRVILVLQNALGESMTINDITILESNQKCSTTEQINIKNNEKAIFTITPCINGPAGKKFDGKIDVTYSLEDKLTHKIIGALRARVVEGSTISSASICQNAQDNSLCNGLDIVFGIGYKGACCNEFSLCCT